MGTRALVLVGALAVSTVVTAMLALATATRWHSLFPAGPAAGRSTWGTAAGQGAALADLVGLVVVAGGVTVGLWYLLTSLAGLGALLGRARGSRARWPERALRRWGAPVLRRVAVAGLSAGLGLGAAVAPAGASEDLPADLGWGSPGVGRWAEESPGRPVTSAAATGDGTPDARSVEKPEGTAASNADPRPATHVVVPGESLWSIAGDHLGPGAADQAIADAWPRWHAANRTAVGDDPGLIHPGLELLVPDEESTR